MPLVHGPSGRTPRKAPARSRRSSQPQIDYRPSMLSHLADREVTPALIHALNHPVRRHILRLLAGVDGEGALLSCVDMAQAPARIFSKPKTFLRTIYFHAKDLRRQGVISIAGTRDVRGATETFYSSNVAGNTVVGLILSNTERYDQDFLSLGPVPQKGHSTD